MSRLRVLVAVAVLAALAGSGVVVLAMGGGEDSRAPAVDTGGRYGQAYAGLCAARSAAAAGEAAGAREVFFDRAHQPLHELASGAAAYDRAVAARLLEAKEAVEAGLIQLRPSLVADLDHLLSATASAAEAVGQALPRRCTQGRT